MNSCLDWYGKNAPVIQSAVCFVCKGKGGGGGLINFKAPKRGEL